MNMTYVVKYLLQTMLYAVFYFRVSSESFAPFVVSPNQQPLRGGMLPAKSKWVSSLLFDACTTTPLDSIQDTSTQPGPSHEVGSDRGICRWCGYSTQKSNEGVEQTQSDYYLVLECVPNLVRCVSQVLIIMLSCLLFFVLYLQAMQDYTCLILHLFTAGNIVPHVLNGSRLLSYCKYLLQNCTRSLFGSVQQMHMAPRQRAIKEGSLVDICSAK